MKEPTDANLRLQELRRLQRQDRKRRLDSATRRSLLLTSSGTFPELVFPCPECDGVLSISARFAGYEAYCSICGHRIEVPDTESELFGTERTGREVQGLEALQGVTPRRLDEGYLASVGEDELVQRAQQVYAANQGNGHGTGDEGGGNGRRSEHNVVLSIVLNKDGEIVSGPMPAGGHGAQSLPDGSSPSEGREAGAKGHGGMGSRKPVRAIKTPVKSTLELAITSDGGKESAPSLTLWQDQSEQREWEKLIAFGIVGLLLLVITAVGVALLVNQSYQQKLAEAPTAEPVLDTGPNAVTELPIASIESADVEEAKWVIRNYISAPNWRERLPFVRLPERVAPMMEQFYATNPDTPIKQTSMEMTWAGYVRGHFLIVVTLADTNYREHYFTLERINDEYKIDWEVLVEYNPMSWKDFREQRPTEPVEFRVSLTADQYYNFQFGNASEFQCFKLASRDEFVGLYGYARRDAPWFKEIDIPPGYTKLVIVKLRFPEQAQGSNQVEIVDYIQQSWVVFPEDLDYTVAAPENINSEGAPGTALQPETAPDGKPKGKTKYTGRPAGPVLSNGDGALKEEEEVVNIPPTAPPAPGVVESN